MALQIRESFVNLTKGYRFGDGDWYEPYTEDRGRLFRAMQREYGRCVSRVYVDPAAGGEPKAIGWVFVKRMEYEDARPSWPRRQADLSPRSVGGGPRTRDHRGRRLTQTRPAAWAIERRT